MNNVLNTYTYQCYQDHISNLSRPRTPGEIEAGIISLSPKLNQTKSTKQTNKQTNKMPGCN